MLFKNIGIVFLFWLISFKSMSQEFGGNPFSTHWKQVRGKSVKVIYPAGLDSIAMQVALSTDVVAQQYNGSLGKHIKPIPIVLQNQPIISNAYVSLAPWRSEFYLMPLQDALTLGSTDWINNLVVHENRHVHQYNNFRKGLSKFMYLLAGQEGQALANAMAIPDWFFEGDAVYHETELLSQGRGRLPSFYDPFRSLWIGNKNYGFQKLRNGSLKDFIPDHYALGYLLVAYGNKKYGETFWGKVTDDAARFKHPIYPFQAAIKRQTKESYHQFVSDAIKSFRDELKDEHQTVLEKPLTQPNVRLLKNYQYPVFIGEDSILALKQSNNAITQWVILSKGLETPLATKEISLDERFNFRNHRIIYTAINFDPRWGWKQYNNIRILDIDSKHSKQLTQNARYFSPDLSHDAKKIIAVHVDLKMKSSLHLMDTSGVLLDSIQSPIESFFSYPVFSDDDQNVFVIERKPNGDNTVVCFNLSNHSGEVLFPFVNAPISYLRCKGDELLFTVSQSDKNELISFNLKQKRFNVLSSEITSSNAGDISPDQKQVVYSHPTSEGEQLFTKPIEFIESILSLQPIRSTELTSAKDSMHTFSFEKYGRAYNLFNFHSWRPSYYTPEWSISAYGQNLLNTLETEVHYVYNQNETSHKIGFNIVSSAHYPWILVGADHIASRSFNLATNIINWDEWNGYAGVKLPLNFSGGKFYRFLNLSSQLNASDLKYDPFNIPKIKDRFIAHMQQGLSYSFYNQKAVQHIYPHWGWIGNITNRTAIGNTHANQFFISNQFYLPGLGKNHSLMLSLTYQQRDTLKQYYFTNNFPMARGYSAVDYPRMWRTSVNYHMPLIYPDLGIGNIVYFLRIRSNVYYDAMWQKSLRTGITTSKKTIGAELHFDTKWWNQQPFSFGIRYSRLLDRDEMNPQGRNRWEFILPIDILPH